jgi:cobalt-zinc-cadmium efflux system membrane fusion protein
MTSRTASIASTLVVATAAALLSGCGRGPGAADPAARPTSLVLPADQRSRIRVETLAPATFTRSVEVTGTVGFDEDRATQVLAPISGPVSRLLVTLGERVRAGQPLASVTSPDFAAAVSAYRKADAAARNARRIAELDEKLFANDAISRRELEQAQTDAVSTESDRDAAKQQLRSLGVDGAAIDDIAAGGAVTRPLGVIRAPIAGTVVERVITPGQLLQAGATPCFTVADLSTVWVHADVFESDLPFVAVGDPADVFAAAADPPLEGKVSYIAAVVDPTTRAVAVRVVTPNPGGALKKDMYVRVAVRSGKPLTGLLVPTSAVLRDDENLPFVYVENADGSFSRRSVTLGYRVGDREEVAAGLAAGDRVVVEGGLFMQFAQSQ